LYDAPSINAKIGQELIVCHLHIIMKHSFPIPVPLL